MYPHNSSQRLLAMAEAAIGSISKKPKGGMSKALELKRTKLWEDVNGRERVPKHTNPLVVAILQQEYNAGPDFDERKLDNKLRKVDTGAVWKRVVGNEFDRLWDLAETKKMSSANLESSSSTGEVKPKDGDPKDGDPNDGDSNDESDEVQKKDESLRVVTTSLKQVLHPDLLADDEDAGDYKRIVDLIEKAQVGITDDLTELSVLVQKTTLQVRCGGLMIVWVFYIL